MAANAIPPTRPPTRPNTRIPAATSATENTAPATTLGTGPKNPACAASTNSITTPINVTATPATASSRLITPSRCHHGVCGARGALRGGGGRMPGGIGAPIGGTGPRGGIVPRAPGI
ncbi:hypothetical protein GCM10009764_31240 [Nocardia ninae]|uniref:Uncharacterized protein n=1 Tax=Nocardia ninae NBRC 108245 TaxID=1210091 RepID=A0A511MNZ9_9NOCA|nr:hypothetical protein NN4_68690 [Nocardia ninae NBRC 108245]